MGLSSRVPVRILGVASKPKGANVMFPLKERRDGLRSVF